VSVETIPGFSTGDIACRGCGRTLTLWFNGGELDMTECCGYRYETRSVGYELVITKTDGEGP
jgi:hypothetical protein